jgi:signal transduction histidine kinase
MYAGGRGGAGQPVTRAEIAQLVGVDEVLLDRLAETGLVRGRAVLSCPTAAATSALVGAAPELRWLCRRLRDEWLRRSPVPWERVARVLADTADPASVIEHGSTCVRALLELDVARAVVEADRLWAVAPHAELAAARIAAMVRAGKAAEARQSAEEWLADRPGDPATVPVLVQLATLEDVASEDPGRMQQWLEQAQQAAGADWPPPLVLATARALYRARELTEAARHCRTLCDAPPPAAGPELSQWLAARSMLAQILAAEQGPLVGLAVLLELPEDLGRGTPDRALLDGVRGRLLWHAGRPREAASAMEAAAALRRALSTIDRARLENNAGLCWYSAGDVERAVAGWERALLGFERMEAELESARVLVNLCQGYRDLGRWSRAEEAGRRAVDIGRKRHIAEVEAVALGNLGDCALWQRRLDKAQQLWSTAEGLARDAGLQGELVELARRRLEVAVARRDPESLTLAEQAEQVAASAHAEGELARCRALKATVLARMGQIEEFRELVLQVTGALRELGASGELALARMAIAEGWVALGRWDEAEQEAQQVLRYAIEFVRPPLRQWADQILTRHQRTLPFDGRLERLTELAVRIALQADLDELMKELATAAVELVDAERAMVLKLQDGEPRVVARAGQLQGDPPSMSIVHRVISLGREVVVADVAERGDLRDATSVVALHLRAVFAVPLMTSGVVEGVLYLDSRRHPAGALSESTALLRALGAHASVALHNAGLSRQIRQRAEEAQEIAHDLRNPLTGVALFAAEALETQEPISLPDTALLLEGAQHAVQLVDALLEPQSSAPTTFALSPWLARRGAVLQVHARKQGIALSLEVDVQGSVRADETALWRVLTNLVTNALMYTPRGGTVTLRTLTDGERMGIEVADSGPGIPEQDLPRIFERGYRPLGSQPGHGLGLAIVSRIVAAHAGVVKARNRPEGGASLTVWMPRAPEGSPGPEAG